MAVDLDTIWELAKDMNGKLDELVEFRAVHEEHHKRLDEKMAGYHETLYESPAGLVYQVRSLAQNGASRKTERRYWRTFWFGVLRTVAAAAIIAITAWLLCLYRGQGTHQAAADETSRPRANQGP